MLPSKDRVDFARKLRLWYLQRQRALPWRSEPSLYKTVVSEFMLQQTQVETVLPYFDRWLRALPDFNHLAEASPEQVLKLWEGLGYYSRARNLQRLAQKLVSLEAIPTDADAWLAFPGVGPYTAAAITSISFNAPAAVVDGNVIRVLARITADATSFKANTEAFKRIKPLADSLLDRAHPGDHNQAIMELGATVCTRNKPLCLTCPVREFCKAGKAGNPEDYPRIERPPTIYLKVNRLWMVHDDALLLQRAPKGARRLAEIYELPRLELLADAEDAQLLAVKRRTITHHQIQEKIHTVEATPKRVKEAGSHAETAWVPLDRLDTVTLSGPHRRWIREIRGQAAAGAQRAVLSA